ncbi:MAG TPA: hypothetical protein P5244_01280, partial [Syntrophales bacterium]|nr:hypothetical protein [Syntrophales bacterium]
EEQPFLIFSFEQNTMKFEQIMSEKRNSAITALAELIRQQYNKIAEFEDVIFELLMKPKNTRVRIGSQDVDARQAFTFKASVMLTTDVMEKTFQELANKSFQEYEAELATEREQESERKKQRLLDIIAAFNRQMTGDKEEEKPETQDTK